MNVDRFDNIFVVLNIGKQKLLDKWHEGAEYDCRDNDNGQCSGHNDAALTEALVPRNLQHKAEGDCAADHTAVRDKDQLAESYVRLDAFFAAHYTAALCNADGNKAMTSRKVTGKKEAKHNITIINIALTSHHLSLKTSAFFIELAALFCLDADQ